MRSRVLKAVYTGLGLVDNGRKSLEALAKELAEKAAVSEEDGEKIALRLRARSNKALTALHKTVDANVQKVITTLHSATRADMRKYATKKRTGRAARRPKHGRRAHSTQSHSHAHAPAHSA